MIPNMILWVLSLPLYLLQFVGNALAFVFPQWITDTIATTIGGSGFLQSIFPMYPHPGMAGLAGHLGIMTIFGFCVTLMGYLIILSLAFKLIKIVLGMFSIGQGPEVGTGGR
jgi:hypothetical protein